MTRHCLPLFIIFAVATATLVRPAAAAAPAEEMHPVAVSVSEQLDDAQQPFVLIVKLTVEPAQAEQLVSVLVKPTKMTLKEPGNSSYELIRSVTEPGVHYLYERWNSLAALDAHLKQPYTAQLLADFDEVLSEEVELKICVPVKLDGAE